MRSTRERERERERERPTEKERMCIPGFFCQRILSKPSYVVLLLLFNPKGIVFNSGPAWKEQRKVSIEILRSLGMGRHKFSDNVQAEVAEFIKVVADHQGQPTDLLKPIAVSVSNNICSAVFGRRFDYDCPSFLRYLELIRENFQSLGSTNLLNCFPWLRFLPGDCFRAKKVSGEEVMVGC